METISFEQYSEALRIIDEQTKIVSLYNKQRKLSQIEKSLFLFNDIYYGKISDTKKSNKKLVSLTVNSKYKEFFIKIEHYTSTNTTLYYLICNNTVCNSIDEVIHEVLKLCI